MPPAILFRRTEGKLSAVLRCDDRNHEVPILMHPLPNGLQHGRQSLLGRFCMEGTDGLLDQLVSVQKGIMKLWLG